MTHSHHWLIDSPKGRFSRGRCKFCGAEKQFANWPEEKGEKFYARAKSRTFDTPKGNSRDRARRAVA